MILHAYPNTDWGLGVIFSVPRTLLLVGVPVGSDFFGLAGVVMAGVSGGLDNADPYTHSLTHSHKGLYCYCLCAAVADLFFSLMFIFYLSFSFAMFCCLFLLWSWICTDMYLALAIVFLEG